MTAAAAVSSGQSKAEREREQLILEYLPRVRKIARSMHRKLPRFICLDDLVSAGVTGLMEAIDNFDPKRNARLTTFADFRIKGSILDSRRETDWAPRRKRRRFREFEVARARLEQKLGRRPTEEEIAGALRLTLDEYRKEVTQLEALTIVALDYAPADRKTVIMECASTEETPEAILQRREMADLIRSSVDQLPENERSVLTFYLNDEMTVEEIARKTGTNACKISRIKHQAIRRLRAWFTEAGITPSVNEARA